MNELKRIEDFRKALTDYKPSADTVRVLQNLQLVLLVGPTSAGRNSIINQLLESGDYKFIVSDTTRQPRENNGVLEQSGREYWFRNEEEVLADVRAGNFLEAAIIHNQQVSGISTRELAKAAVEDKIAIDEIEPAGADIIFAVKPDAKFIFVLPPSFDEWMVRMKGRGVLPEDEVRRRLESAVKEITTALNREYYHLVINDTFKHAARTIDAISRGEISQKGSQAEAEAREVATQLLVDIKATLEA